MISAALCTMIGAWSIGSLTESIWIGLIVSGCVSALIVMLPIWWICMHSMDVLDKGIAYILGGTSFFLYFILQIGIGCTVVVR